MSCGCARNRPLPEPEGNPKGQTDKAQSPASVTLDPVKPGGEPEEMCPSARRLAAQALHELAWKFRMEAQSWTHWGGESKETQAYTSGNATAMTKAARECELKADELAEIGVTCQPEQKEGGTP